MRKLLANYTLTLAGLVVTFVLYLFASFGLHLSNENQYVVFAIGIMTTLVIATFEHEVPKLFTTQIDKKIEIYRLFSQIEEGDFRKWAQDIIADSEYKLRQLAQGEFRSSMGARYEIGRLNQAHKTLRAVYLGTVYQSTGLHSWTTSPEEERYYNENLDAIKRGVEITRIFILDKSKTVDYSNKNIKDQVILNIMQKQCKDGILVKIAWQGDVVASTGPEVLKDFVILDNLEVDTREYTPDSNYEIVFWRNPAKIQYYEHIFSTLQRYSQTLENFLKSLQDS